MGWGEVGLDCEDEGECAWICAVNVHVFLEEGGWGGVRACVCMCVQAGVDGWWWISQITLG